jgi:hypothetical protein
MAWPDLDSLPHPNGESANTIQVIENVGEMSAAVGEDVAVGMKDGRHQSVEVCPHHRWRLVKFVMGRKVACFGWEGCWSVGHDRRDMNLENLHQGGWMNCQDGAQDGVHHELWETPVGAMVT